jgi:hypothetical protein
MLWGGLFLVIERFVALRAKCGVLRCALLKINDRWNNGNGKDKNAGISSTLLRAGFSTAAAKCAASGRDDDCGGEMKQAKAKTEADPYGMTTKKAKATATATATANGNCNCNCNCNGKSNGCGRVMVSDR